ncbi:uncharacterized protein [Rutidosis leptorrhynchoides]|uniref:uncharacterized protein n=1 Tax=Rutidosis leptorrhynchoides TaxID=125765 RepID=UPI003A9A4440
MGESQSFTHERCTGRGELLEKPLFAFWNSKGGTHFANHLLEKVLKKYGIIHKFSTAYHPQTSGQVENTNRALKRILEKTVNDNPKIWQQVEHRAYWALKNVNMDLEKAGENRLVQLNELDELRLDAYENSFSYKEKTKCWHDARL